MDCEQFDQIVLDVLYGDLSDSDELAAARRHMDRCERCSEVLASLRSTRRAVSLPLVSPPTHIRDRVMEAAHAAQRRVPWPNRVGRWVSVAGSYAMRPQLAMAALLLLMIGSSLLLLRGRPGSGLPGTVRVTEQGVPERDQTDSSPRSVPNQLEPLAAAGSLDPRAEGAHRPSDPESPRDRRARAGADSGDIDHRNQRVDELQRLVAEADGQHAETPPPAPNVGDQSPPASAGTEPPADDYAAAMAMYQAGDFANAYRAFDRVAQQGGANAASAMLYAAKSVRNSAGCPQSLPRFESVMARFGSTSAGVQARWEAAACARILGDYPRARQYLSELAQIESQRERAEAELARISPSHGQNQNAQRAPASAAPANRNQQQPARRNATDRANAY